ncbi:LPXTG cell wall anchor domain-containing protein [Schleiferilactobacillus shenzhenensis]|uniref:LPXTG cell wall anchor domain-containing protein n=1 Tax=Schleiferilactobacillus shenzhenensis TaxID=1231337 RepID=UPI0018CAEF44|nr:LPXTG cell wall anchor domain-containing protein [Schleiferilactobacillus shenzhenensis]
MIRKPVSNQRPYWKKILFFGALFLFLVGIVVGVSRASAIAASSDNSGTVVEKAAPVASSGVPVRNPQSNVQVKIISKDNVKPHGQSNIVPTTNNEPGTQAPLINIGTNTKFPQTGEKVGSGQMILGVLLVLITVAGFAFSIKRRTEL